MKRREHVEQPPQWKLVAESMELEAFEWAIGTYHEETERIVKGWHRGHGRTQAARFVLRDSPDEQNLSTQIEAHIRGSDAMAAAEVALRAREWALMWCHEIADENDGTRSGFDREAWLVHLRGRKDRARQELVMHLEGTA